MVSLTTAFVALVGFVGASQSAVIVKRDASVYAYTQAVDGLDASVEGSGYLTFKALNGYDIDACQKACNAEGAACQSINIYREFFTSATDNPQYKCGLWDTAKYASDVTNKGGQDQDYGGLTKIEWSQIRNRGSKYANTPVKGAILASSAGGYLGARDIGPAYAPELCAAKCDATEGCVYANIWQGWSQSGGNDRPTCALFDGSAVIAGNDVNYGQGELKVTNSRVLTKQ